MGKITLEYVISYSSQDKYCKAENLLQSPNGKPWLCAPDYSSGRLVAEFQLSRASRIDYIDIGNHGSSTIEIQVGRSSFQSKTQYVPFLPAITIGDGKENGMIKTVSMFNKCNFDSEAASETWDRIKVICCRHPKHNSQYGLQFIHLANTETRTEFSFDDDPRRLMIHDRSITKPSTKDSLEEFKLTRGKQLLNASRSKISHREEKPHSPTFEEDIGVFLIACFGEDENKGAEEYMKEFEEQSQQTLNTTERSIFRIKYMEIRGNAFISRHSQEGPFAVVKDTSESFNSQNGFVKSAIPSFDSEFSSPVRRKSSDLDEADNTKKPTKRLKTPAKYSKVAEILNISPEDFIQSDGVQPSTSSGVTYVECPICREYFPSQEIETHASTCGDLTADVEYLYSSKSNGLPSINKEDSFITCLFCLEVYPERLVSSHMDVCVSK